MSTLAHVQGLDELKRRLDALPKQIARKALKRAVGSGARIIQLAAYALAPVGRSHKGHVAGTLKRAAIIKFVASESNDTQVEYIVTFRQGKRAAKSQSDAYYARWVEFGHRIVPRGRSAKSVSTILRNKRTLAARRRTPSGEVAPHRFLGPAFDATSAVAVDAIARRLRTEIESAGSL